LDPPEKLSKVVLDKNELGSIMISVLSIVGLGAVEQFYGIKTFLLK
jgi:hypothetical protein